MAIGLSVATLLLIFVGGLVTNTGSALAVPDWPTTFGYNMFLYPWSEMVEGIFYEHSHRLMGSLVGLLTMVLAVLLWRTESVWLRWLGGLALLLVVIQGVLGGLRVLLQTGTLAVVHGALAQAFFGLAVALALVSSGKWFEEGRWSAPASSLRWLGLLMTFLIYVQIVFGALLTHWGRLDAHLGGALLLFFLIPAFSHLVQRRHRDRSEFAGPAIAMNVLFAIQLLLGLGAYVARFTSLALPASSVLSVALPVTHRVVGALIFGASLMITLRLFRLGRVNAKSIALSGTPLGVTEGIA
jgi:cytochrome c oxidase assembly protein subunit 15